MKEVILTFNELIQLRLLMDMKIGALKTAQSSLEAHKQLDELIALKNKLI